MVGAALGRLVALRRSSVDLVNGRVTVVDRLCRDRRRCASSAAQDRRRTTYRAPATSPAPRARRPSRALGRGRRGCLAVLRLLGAPLVRSNFTVHWTRARAEVDLPAVRFHDLRHLSATLAATTGATTRELMARMGHSSPRAALIYQHAAADRGPSVSPGDVRPRPGHHEAVTPTCHPYEHIGRAAHPRTGVKPCAITLSPSAFATTPTDWTTSTAKFGTRLALEAGDNPRCPLGTRALAVGGRPGAGGESSP